MAGVKIVDLPSLGRDLISTDLLELSLVGGSGSRKITGQEIMNASKLNVGATPIINGTAGRILFQGAGDVLGESANLFWDNTNGRLGIGTSSPLRPLEITGSATSGFDVISFKGQYNKRGYLGNDNLYTYFASGATTTESYLSLSANNAILRSPTLIDFQIASSIRMSIFSTGNVAINTTTDAGYKLDVNGTARVQNTITLTGINTPNLANLPLALGNFTLDVQTTNPNSATGSIITTGAITKTDSGVKSIINVNNAVTSTAANFNTLNGFAFTSTISQTLGTIRGIYIAPTLTASTDFRAIETTAGNVLFGTTSGSVGVGTTSPIGRNGYGGGTAIEVVNNTTYASFNLNGGNIASPTYFTLGAQGGSADIRVNNKPLTITVNSIDAFKIATTGNIGINTTTDAGYKLDVNGTARVGTGSPTSFYQRNFAVSGTTGDIGAGIFNSSTTGTAGVVLGESNTIICGFTKWGSAYSGNYSGTSFPYANSFQVQNGSSNNLGVIIQGTPIVFTVGLTSTNLGIRQDATCFKLGTLADVHTSGNASAKMQIDSTTQGFLPPRMTNAQRAAIASPAVGLIVYCTDSTEGLYVYKSTGWTFMV